MKSFKCSKKTKNPGAVNPDAPRNAWVQDANRPLRAKLVKWAKKHLEKHWD